LNYDGEIPWSSIKYVRIADWTNTDVWLFTELAKTEPQTINIAKDITLGESFRDSYIYMQASHTLNISPGITLTIINNNKIYTRYNTLSITGGGTVTIANTGTNASNAHGIIGPTGTNANGNTGTLSLTNVTLNLNNYSTDPNPNNAAVGGLGYLDINVNNGAAVNIDSTTAHSLLEVDRAKTLTINSGGTVNVNNIAVSYTGSSGIVVNSSDTTSGTLHMNGGTLNINTSVGYGLLSRGLIKYTSGTLSAANGAGIDLAQGSKVEGMNGKLHDRSETLTDAGQITVGAVNAEASATGLSAGPYTWNGSLFDKVIDNTPPTISLDSVRRYSDTHTTIYFNSSEPGNIYTLVKDSKDDTLTNENVKADGNRNGSAYSELGQPDDFDATLTAGVKYVYVVVEDRLGNLSNRLEVEVEALAEAKVLSVGGASISSWAGGGYPAWPYTASVTVPYNVSSISPSEVKVLGGTATVYTDANFSVSGTVSLAVGTATPVRLIVRNGQTVTYYNAAVTRSQPAVTYDGNGATGGTVPTDGNSPYAEGATVTVLGNTGNLVKTGYAFDGWSLTPDGAAVTSFTINADTTLYARWTPNPLTFGDKTLTAGTVGVGYTADVTAAANGSGTYTYAVTSGTLPAGLTMSEAGAFSGTPAAPVTGHTFTVTATDSITGAAANATYTITIAKGTQDALSITGLNSPYVYGDTFNIGVSGGSSGGAVTYESSDTAVATVTGNTVSIVGVGTFTITATMAGGTGWEDVSAISGTITANRAPQAAPTIEYRRFFDIEESGYIIVEIESPASGAVYSKDNIDFSDNNRLRFPSGTESAVIYAKLSETATHLESDVASFSINFSKRDHATPDPFTMTYIYNSEYNNYTVTIPEISGVKYKFNDGEYGDAHTITANPGDTVTGYVYYPESTTHNASPARSSILTLPTVLTSAVVSITAPVTNVNSAAATTTGTGYTVTSTAWKVTDGAALTTGQPFAPGTAYTATIVLTSTAGYKFGTVPPASVTGTNGTVASAATSGGDSSNTLTVTVNYTATAALPKAATPTTAEFNGATMTLSGVTTSMSYSLNGGAAYTTCDGTTVDLSAATVTTTDGIWVIARGDNTTNVDSDPQKLTITKAATPTDVSKTDETTAAGTNDGTLGGVTTGMEYRLSTTATWTGGTGSTINDLAPGTYHVRTKGGTNTLPSDQITLIVGAYGSGDNTAPTVVSISPSGTGVALSGNIVVTFSEPIANGTDGICNVQYGGGAAGVMGARSWSVNNTVLTVPYSGLSENTQYTIMILNFKDAADNVMEDSRTHQFTTAADAPTPTVTSVSVSPSTIEAQKGTTQQFTATVTGTNNPSTTVIWEVSGGIAGTSIDTSGLLTVAAGETATTLTVTATSTADGTKKGTAIVTVTSGAPTPTYGITLDTSGTHTFPAATAGYSAQTAKTVTITNTGNTATGALTIALSGTNASSFTLSKTNITDIVSGGNDTFTIVPKTGLAAGTYTATVTVDGANVTAQSFNVSFTVNSSGSTPPSGGSTGGGTTANTTTDIGGSTVKTPSGQKPVANSDGSVTLPGGGTVETDSGVMVDAPAGTTVDADGGVTIPDNKTAEITFPGGETTVTVPGGTTVSGSGSITVGDGKATIDLPSGTEITIPGGSVISGNKVTIGSGGGAVTGSDGSTYTYDEGEVLILDEDVPLGFYVQHVFPFNDVAKSAWYYDAVKYVYDNGLMNGIASDTFDPTSNLNRAMMVQILYNLEGATATGSASFGDVESGAWYADAIAWATSNGIVNGVGNNLFAPTQEITREQMAVMLYNYCVFKGTPLPVTRTGSFADAGSINGWAVEAVNAMYQAGILNGKGEGAFDPQGKATRAEIAQMFMNFIEAIK